MTLLLARRRLFLLNLLFLLGFAPIIWADPAPNYNASYSFNCIANMPTNSGTAGAKSLGIGGTLKQTFIPKSDAFLSAFNRQDSNGVRSVALTAVSLYLYGYVSGSTPSTFNVGISKVETNGTRTLLCSQDFQQTVWGWTIRTWAFSNACLVDFDQTYELAVTLAQSGGGVNLLIPSGDYPDGACSAGGDVWFSLTGSSLIPVFTNLTVTGVFTNAPSTYTNAYFFDTSTNQDLTSYDNLKGKFLGVNGHPEKLKFTCPLGWAPVFSIADTNLASCQVQTSTSASNVTNTATLNGLAEGETFLFARSGNTVVGYWKLQSHPQRTIKLSYTYIRYPTEITNYLYTNYPIISSYISSIYARANVAIIWTSNGVLTCDWDLNRDGSSYTADNSEMWLPLDSGLIPNQEKVFSNVYGLRDYTNNLDYHGASGGGTSRGTGATDIPPRGAMKRINLQSSNSVTIGSTLAHEVGHNLGLYHVAVGTPATDDLMDVGRLGDNLWSWQWAIIHNTLSTLFDVPPAVALAAPTNGASFLPSATVNLSATILTNRNPITRVEFYSGGTNLLGTVTNAPYTLAWTNVSIGSYPLTAVAYDNQWMVSTSTVASIAVVLAPPAVTLTAPANNAVINSNLVALSANVSSNGNAINKVEFLSGGLVVGAVSNAPYTLNWSGVSPGNCTLKARVWFGPTNATVDSAAASVVVNGAPAFTNSLLRVSPAVSGIAYVGSIAGAATDPNAGQSLAYAKLSGPAWMLAAANGTLVGTPAASDGGTNDFTVRVTDPYGLTGDATLRIVVNVPPAITAPPQPLAVAAGRNAVFSVTATGTAPLAYQWRFNGTNLAAANAPAYTVAGAQSQNAGLYSVIITNLAGSVTSSAAALTVTTPAAFVAALGVQGGNLMLSWSGGTPPYQLQSATNLMSPVWADVGAPTTNQSIVLIPDASAQLYRVRGQ